MKQLLIAAFVLLAACAPVQKSSTISQRTNTRLTASVGDTVITISIQKNAQDASDSSAIVKSKRPAAMMTLQYVGLKDSQASFIRRGVLIDPDAVLINGAPIANNNGQAKQAAEMTGVVIYNDTPTLSRFNVIPPRPTPHLLELGSSKIYVALDKGKGKFSISGKKIEIENANDKYLVYYILE